MDSYRFDALTRSLTVAGSRRHALAAALGGLITLGALSADAKKDKRTKKKPKLNAFGCVDVGKACQGNDSKCCSGICQGKKPKKGEKDKSKCVAHNTGGCTAERSACFTGNQSSLCGPQALCLATTGNAGFCADSTSFSQEANCRACSTDQDCEAAGFAPGSACVLINQGFCATSNTTCAGISGSSGTACLPPGA